MTGGKEPGRNTTCMVNVSDALQVQTVLGSSAQAVRQLGNRQGPFQNILLCITACRESVNWKAPLTGVMNCTLSQTQNEEIINCFPAGTEKPRNLCDL